MVAGALIHLTSLRPGRSNLPGFDLIHRRQDQIPGTVNPVLKPRILVNDEVFGPFLVGHAAVTLDRVLAARMDKESTLALGVTDTPVGGLQPVLDAPGALGGNDLDAVLPEDAVISGTSG